MPDDSAPHSLPTQPGSKGCARVQPAHHRYAPSMQLNRWYDVIPHPADLGTQPLEGYVWIDLDGRPRSLPARRLEIERVGPEGDHP